MLPVPLPVSWFCPGFWYDGIVTITSRYTLRFILLMNDYISNRTSDATTRRLWYKIGTIHKRGALTGTWRHMDRITSTPIYHLAWQGTFTSWAAGSLP